MAAISALIVSSDGEIVSAVQSVLTEMGVGAQVAGSLEEAARAVAKSRYDALLLQTDALGALIRQRLRNGFVFAQEPPVIAVARNGSVAEAVLTARAGVWEYLCANPANLQPLKGAVKRLLSELHREGNGHVPDTGRGLPPEFPTADDRMRSVWETLSSVADLRVTVLMNGESGTGKTLMARILHERSDRRLGLFVEVNCGAFPEPLLDREVFGQVQGALPSADSDRCGKFALADGGTLFLDDLTNASPSFHASLFRAIVSGEFERAGDTRRRTSDVRCIIAEKMPFRDPAAQQRFREKFCSRLPVVEVTLPPLRERVVDIPLLARHFLQLLAMKHRRPVEEFSTDALDRLVHYSWPGNVRELMHVIEYGVVLARDKVVRLPDLPPPRVESAAPLPRDGGYVTLNRLREALREPERRCILEALRSSRGNCVCAARDLRVSRSTLYKKIKQYGLEADEWREVEPSPSRVPTNVV